MPAVPDRRRHGRVVQPGRGALPLVDRGVRRGTADQGGADLVVGRAGRGTPLVGVGDRGQPHRLADPAVPVGHRERGGQAAHQRAVAGLPLAAAAGTGVAPLLVPAQPGRCRPAHVARAGPGYPIRPVAGEPGDHVVGRGADHVVIGREVGEQYRPGQVGVVGRVSGRPGERAPADDVAHPVRVPVADVRPRGELHRRPQRVAGVHAEQRPGHPVTAGQFHGWKHTAGG